MGSSPSNTLRQVRDEDTKQDSIVSAMNHSYSEIASGHITSAQMELEKLFVKVVCTAFWFVLQHPLKIFLVLSHTKVIRI